MENQIILHQPYLSIIMPVFNVRNYLKDAVNSVLVQSFTNFELILVDDGSTDSSNVLCDEISLLDSRVKVLHQTNQGVSQARNNGLKCANGIYVMYMDSDDLLPSDALKTLISFASKNPSVHFIQGAHKIYRGGKFYDSQIDKTRQEACERVISSNEYFHEVLMGHMFSVNVLIKKDFLVNNRILFPSGIGYSEDALWWINLLSIKSDGMYVNQCTYIYRMDVPGSASFTSISDNKIRSTIFVAKGIKNLLSNFFGSGKIAINDFSDKLAFSSFLLIISHGKNKAALFDLLTSNFKTLKASDSVRDLVIAKLYTMAPKLTFLALSNLYRLKK